MATKDWKRLNDTYYVSLKNKHVYLKAELAMETGGHRGTVWVYCRDSRMLGGRDSTHVIWKSPVIEKGTPAQKDNTYHKYMHTAEKKLLAYIKTH